jgi:hypothetical protein
VTPRIRTALACVAIFGAIMAVAGGALFGLRVGLSVAVGAGVAAANLWALAKIIGAIASPDSGAGLGVWGVLAGLKMIGLFLLVWLLWRSGAVDPLALVVGYTALPLGITVGALVSDRIDPDEPEPPPTP